MMKSSFVMYTEYAEQIELLSMEQRGLLFTAIMAYAAGNDMPEMDAVTAMAFSFIRSRMDADNEKYQKTCEARREAGKKGGRPKAEQKNHDEAEKADASEENQKEAKKANGFFEKQNNPDIDNDIDNDKKESTLKGTKEKSPRFIPPTIDDVMEYCKEKRLNVDCQRFVDFYESKGWMIGKNKMKDWRAAVRNWARGQRQELTAESSKRQGGTTKGNRFHNFEQRDYDYDALLRQINESSG